MIHLHWSLRQHSLHLYGRRDTTGRGSAVSSTFQSYTPTIENTQNTYFMKEIDLTLC